MCSAITRSIKLLSVTGTTPTAVFFAAAFAASTFTVDAAHAKFINLGKHTVGEIRSACSKAGGQFDVAPDGGGYGCTKKNCDGQGGKCSVACNNNNECKGEVPALIYPVRGKFDLGQVLGTGVSGDRASGGGKPPKTGLKDLSTTKKPDKSSPTLRTGTPTQPGLLEGGQSSSPSQGPSTVGSPAAPSAPAMPAGKLY